jgi:hypothetical protein
METILYAYQRQDGDCAWIFCGCFSSELEFETLLFIYAEKGRQYKLEKVYFRA